MPDLFDGLCRVHDVLATRGIWHTLAYGTLLGAVRDGDLVPWDDDIDLFVRPEDRGAVLACAEDFRRAGITLTDVRYKGTHLAVRPRGLREFDGSIVRMFRGGKKLGDLFLFTLFDDGILRRYDLASEVYWSPHASFPHFFAATPATASVRGRAFPALAHATKWLEVVYGRGWRTPRRSRALGGHAQRNRNIYGHRVAPHLKRDVAWCVSQGWDRAVYSGRPAWPRQVRGGGPIGPAPRTEGYSNSLWWRDLRELVRYF